VNLIEYLRAAPRCSLCHGAGRVPYTTRAGQTVLIPCSCLRLFDPPPEVVS
jgi:hypothetical protein